MKQLCADNKSWFICDEFEFFVQDKTREIVYQGKSKPEELFQIPVIKHINGLKCSASNPVAYVGKVIKSDVWHQRLGHFSLEILSSMLQQSSVTPCVENKNSLYSMYPRKDV